MRQCFRVAWTKASQVWITGLKTGEFERLVYAGKLDDSQFGIIRPDFIGEGIPAKWKWLLRSAPVQDGR